MYRCSRLAALLLEDGRSALALFKRIRMTAIVIIAHNAAGASGGPWVIKNSLSSLSVA